MDLKTQQLELERERNQISWAQYSLQKKELETQKASTNTQAMIAQDIKNKLAARTLTKEQITSTEYLAAVGTQIGFEGNMEDLATIVMGAYNGVISDKGFMDSLNKPTTTTPAKTRLPVGKSFNTWGGATIGEILYGSNGQIY